MPTTASSSRATLIGVLLTRVVVPLWVLAGALFKLYEAHSPKNLPGLFLTNAKDAGLDLEFLLRLLIGCELFAVGVMLLVPRFARAMAIFMLSCFCAILIGEMIRNATHCGCFGSLPIKPWQMLIVDGLLLTGVLASWLMSADRNEVTSSRRELSVGSAIGVAIIIAIASMSIALGVPNRPEIIQQPADIAAAQPNTTQPTVALDATINPQPKPLPSSWYTQEIDKWVGKPWREVELFQLMPTWPRDMDKGKRYIIFYSRTCEHCLMMFDMDLQQRLDGLITLVEFPAGRTHLRDPGAWELPMHVEPVLKPEMLTLPMGTNWLIQTPLVIAVTDGVVTCAQEGEHKKCLGIQ